MTTMRVHLYRDCMTTPWGFRLQGGKDLNQPLVIQRVFTNSPAEGELQRGDLIVTINGRDAENLTHKQAQDLIKYGGGQLEFLIERPPPGRAQVAPLTPTIHTKAPTFPQSPTKAPTIIIPIQRRHSGPPSPVRSPVRSPSRPAASRLSLSPGSKMPQPYSSGFQPKKVTLNKYGGGGYDFGSTPSPKYRPVQPNFKPAQQPVQQQYHSPPSPQYQAPAAPQYHAPQYQAPQQPAYQAPPAQQAYRPDPDAVDSSHLQFQQAQQFHQSHQPQSAEERGVEEEEYGGVNERKKMFLRGEQRGPQADVMSDEDDYPTAPVWERRKLFAKNLNQTRAIHRTNKTFKPKRPVVGEALSFGVDYTSPHSFAPPSAPPKPAPKPRPPPVNTSVQDDIDSGAFPWSSTLKSEGLKPWEREALIQEAYQNQPPHSVIRPSEHHIPKITQISAQSRARPTQQQPGGGQSHGKQPVPLGERDWSDSHVYRMVQEEKKTSTYGVPGQPNQTVTTTRVTNETSVPGHAPQRTVKESVTTSSLDPRFDDELGISDF